ncbi:MAG: hypothetical protein HN849_05975 [Victivallales bacterium]|nr:hypothetical protein [Victivallales bacterium]
MPSRLCPMIALASLFITANSALGATRIVVSPASPPVTAIDVAKLYVLGKSNVLEECHARLGLSLRPWNGKAYQDYRWVHKTGEAVAFRMEFPGRPGIDRVVLCVWDWHGQIVASQSFGPGPVDEVAAMAVNGYGTWLLTLDAYEGKELRSRLLRGFSIVPDVTAARRDWRRTNDYFLGSCFFPRRYYRWPPWFYRDRAPYADLTAKDAVDRVVELGARCGLTVLRTDYFGCFPHKPASRNDWPIQDEVYSLLRKHDMQADMKVQLFRDSFQGATLKLDQKVFRRWAADMDYLAEHLVKGDNSSVFMVELGNEPAHHEFWAGTREQYQWLVNYGTKVFRTAKPDLPVVHGGTCPPGADLAMRRRENPEEYARVKAHQTAWYSAFSRDLAPAAQWWPYHFHGALTKDMTDWRKAEEGAVRQAGFTGRPFVQTEGGSCAWRPDREVTSWVEVMQKILHSWSNGERGWLQYSLVFHAKPGRNTDGNGWTLLHGYVLSPRFQYGALAALVKTMAGCTLDRILLNQEADGKRTLLTLFNHPKGKLLAGFAQGGKAETALRTDARRATLVDPMGNAIPAPASALTLGPEPIYLLLEGATNVSLD